MSKLTSIPRPLELELAIDDLIDNKKIDNFDKLEWIDEIADKFALMCENIDSQDEFRDIMIDIAASCLAAVRAADSHDIPNLGVVYWPFQE